MSFVERVNQGESLASWLNWLTEPPAVSRSVIMGHLTAIWKGEIWALSNAFRTGPGSCAVHSMLIKCVNSIVHYRLGQHAIKPLRGQSNYVFGLGGQLDWQRARVKCWETGMDLAIVESEEANNLLASKYFRLCYYMTKLSKS